jgi:hypothetical protein
VRKYVPPQSGWKADAGKGGPEARRPKSNPQIAGDCEAEARLGRDPVDGSDSRDGQGPDAGHDALSLPNKGLRVLFSQVLHDSQVPATAESLPGPREYEDA